jgi:hypothetical protein
VGEAISSRRNDGSLCPLRACHETRDGTTRRLMKKNQHVRGDYGVRAYCSSMTLPPPSLWIRNTAATGLGKQRWMVAE